MLRRDPEATKKAGFKDKRSFVGYRLHPGTRNQCEYLKGKDASRRREEIRCWYNWQCAECGRYCGETGEMHHIIGGLGLQRCWCLTNLIWLCPPCHRDKHVMVRWRRALYGGRDEHSMER